MKKLRYCVYVLYSLRDTKFHIGSTTDLRERLTYHFRGLAKSTAARRPLRFIFCEYFVAKGDALRRERYFKTSPGKRTLTLMLRESLKDIRSKPA